LTSLTPERRCASGCLGEDEAESPSSRFIEDTSSDRLLKKKKSIQNQAFVAASMVKPARVSEKENQKTRHRNINHQQNDNNVHTRDLRVKGGGGVLSVDWENRDHPASDAQCTIEPVMLELLFLVHLSTHLTLQNYAVYRTAIYNVNIHAVSRASECSLSG
jgi:hypothetical protein